MSVRVLHLSDSHVKHRHSTDHFGLAEGVRFLRQETTLDTLRSVVDRLLTEPDFDLVLHTGDLSDDGDPKSVAACLDQLGRLGAPLLATPGNHDDPAVLGEAMGADVAGAQVRTVGPWTVIGLCSARPGQEHGTIGDDQLAELHRALAAAAGPVALALHHPPVTPCPDPDCQLTDADELMALARRHGAVRAVLTGHLHLADAHHEHGIDFLLGPSTCLQLDHVHPLAENNLAPTPLGARVVELGADGSVTSDLRWW